MTSRYGWGDNEPKILPGSQGGDQTNLFGIKIKALFTDLFAKLNIDANKLDGIQAGAEKNKNAFAKIKVGSSLILADNQEDTFEIVPGSNVIVTPDAINDKVTIGLPPSLDINVTGSAAKCNGCGEIMPTELTNSNEGSLRMSGFYQTTQGVANGSSAGTSYASIIQASRNNSRINRIILRGDTSKPLVYHQAYNENTWGPLTRFVMEGDNITGSAASLSPGAKINGVLFNGTQNITITAAANGGTSAACSGNAASATKATQDSRGQQIDSTYIKGLSVNGRVITYTRGNGSTGTITTQDTNTTYTLQSLGGAPKPQTAAGVGQWVNFNTTLPSGGTWAFFKYEQIHVGGSGGNDYHAVRGGVAAGGSQVGGYGVAWRVA